MIAENMTPVLDETRPAISEQLRDRMHGALQRELSFVPNPLFTREREAMSLTGCQRVDQVESEGRGPTVQLRPGLPAHLLRLCETSLMTAEEEVAAFRRMNFLKYFYNHLRMRLCETTVSERRIQEMEDLLVRAERIRNDIVCSSVRLVISIVKKYCTPHCVFDDLLSEGIMSLLRAVDNFDFEKGFRFSTYATRIIHRDLWRAIGKDQKNRLRFNTGNDPVLDGRSDETTSMVSDRNSTEVLGMLDQLLETLDERERVIISARFGLETSGKKETFTALGKQLGVSKERIRQLAERALKKLQDAANQLGLDETQWVA